MTRYSIGHISHVDGDKELTVIDVPWWTQWQISLGYCMMRLTGDRAGLWLVSHGYRVQDRRRRMFRLPVTQDVFEEFQRWKRAARTER